MSGTGCLRACLMMVLPATSTTSRFPWFTAYIREGFDIQDYPAAYDTYKNLITLPYHTHMTVDDVELVCAAVERAVKAL